MVRTVWLLTFGCQSLVLKNMTGGRNGYSCGILMSTMYVPPSYGVSGGPGNEASRCVRSDPLADSANILDSVSAWISDSSLAILRRRFEAILGRMVGYSRSREAKKARK